MNDSVIDKTLKNLPGFDFEDVLSNLDGDWDFLKQLLGVFQHNLMEQSGELMRVLEQDDMGQARHLVHTIKGTTSQVGATALHALALQLEQELKSGLPPSQAPTLAPFQAQIKDVLAMLVGVGL